MRPYSLILLVLLLPARVAAQDYEIKLDRPEKVGEHSMIHATGTSEQHLVMAVGGKAIPPKDEKFSVEMDADREVVAVSDEAQPTKLRVTITKVVRLAGGQSAELLPAGSVVLVEKKNRKESFTDVMGAELPKDVQEALGTILTLGDGKSNDDRAFGTTERKDIGDAWPIHADFASKNLGEQQIQVDPANVTGTVTLVGVAMEQGQPCLRIDAKFTMKDVAMPLPPGVKVTTGTVSATMSGLFPTDQKNNRLQQSIGMEMKVEAAGKVGQPGKEQDFSMSMTFSRSSNISIKPQQQTPPSP